MEISFISQASYDPIATGPPPKVDRPALVPILDFEKMQENLKLIKEQEARQAKQIKMKVNKSPEKLPKKALSADCKNMSDSSPCSCSDCHANPSDSDTS